jgi:hypothetical protein
MMSGMEPSEQSRDSLPVVFETIACSRARRQDPVPVLGVALICGSIAAGWSRGGTALALALCVALAAAIAVYAYLLQTAAPVRYVPYCRIDERGFHYENEPGEDGWSQDYAWSDIDGVAEHTDIFKDDGPGISLFLNRSGMRGVPVFLGMDREHARQAVRILAGHGVAKH